MTPGLVYYVSWLDRRVTIIERCGRVEIGTRGVTREALFFKGQHPSGMLMFERLDGLSIHLKPSDVGGYQLAEANR